MAAFSTYLVNASAGSVSYCAIDSASSQPRYEIAKAGTTITALDEDMAPLVASGAVTLLASVPARAAWPTPVLNRRW